MCKRMPSAGQEIQCAQRGQTSGGPELRHSGRPSRGGGIGLALLEGPGRCTPHCTERQD